MVLFMANPTKSKNGVYYFTARVPADLIGKVGKKVYSFSLGTKDPQEARKLFLAAAAQKEREHTALRSAPGPIAHRALVALAGKAYRDFVERRQNEPGEPSMWTAFGGLLERLQAGGYPAKLKWYGDMADRLLLDAGHAADEISRGRLIEELHKVFELASEQLLRMAEGDYRADPNLERFPSLPPSSSGEIKPKAATDSSLSITNLFELWKKDHVANGRAAATVDEYETKTADFVTWLKHDDALRVTGKNIADYLDHLRYERSFSSKTVGGKYLTCLRAIFRKGKSKFVIPANPAEDVEYTIVKPALGRAKGYSDEEARRILTAANTTLQVSDRRSHENKIACRWVPWLCAYTGARVAEITQLTKANIGKEHDIQLLTITPDAGSVKTRTYRVVPIHPHLVEMGFLDFVMAAPDGPLFYKENGRERKARNTQAKETGNAVGRWIKSVSGVDDVRVKPNHAFRHRFKTIGREAGIDLRYLDAIQGHSDGSASTEYGEVTIKALDREMRKIPRVEAD